MVVPLGRLNYPPEEKPDVFSFVTKLQNREELTLIIEEKSTKIAAVLLSSHPVYVAHGEIQKHAVTQIRAQVRFDDVKKEKCVERIGRTINEARQVGWFFQS